jgi:hypothetical protein
MKKQVIDQKKLELLSVIPPESAIQGVEDLMIFDARCLDRGTWLEWVRVLPELTVIRKAWRAHFTVHVVCHVVERKLNMGQEGFAINASPGSPPACEPAFAN